MAAIRFLRRALRVCDRILSRLDNSSERDVPGAPRTRYNEIERFIRSMDPADEEARSYMATHIERIVRTLTLVPEPGRTKRALELGTYMHMTPALACVFGYRDVRGAHFGQVGEVETKSVQAGGREIFRCEIDLFNVELDRFPYPDGHFDTVLACEIIEHLVHDPMHMLLEIHRVLDEGGALVLTTPNIVSFTAVSCVLNAGHPQLFSIYPKPSGERAELPHVREYTPRDVGMAAEAAGFEVEYLFTEKIAGHDSDRWVRPFLQMNNYSTKLRGEQIYCVARKRSSLPATRYPWFLYEPC